MKSQIFEKRLNRMQIAKCKNIFRKFVPENAELIRIGFNKKELIKMIGNIEDKISAYLQNIKINQPIGREKKVKCEDEDEDEEENNGPLETENLVSQEKEHLSKK